MPRQAALFPLLLPLMLALTPAHAGKHRYDASNATWRSECGACHLAYPPALLPRTSWRAVMDGLSEHFGTDASVDAAAHAEIAAFLENNAGRDRERAVKPPLRITESRWFRHEHDEVRPAVWRGSAVKSPANCPACHTRAEAGDFDESGLRLPR